MVINWFGQWPVMSGNEHLLNKRAERIHHVLEYVRGVRLAVVGAAELRDKPWLNSHPVEELKSKCSLPRGLVWIQELDDKGEKYLALGDKEAVVAFHKDRHHS